MKAEMRQELAELPYEEKIRKVGELIRLRQKIRSDVSASEPAARESQAQSGRQSTGLLGAGL